MENLHNQIGEFIPDKLIADTQIAIRVEGIVLEKGQGILKRGTLLGKKSADNLYRTVNNANADGTKTPVCILTDDVDTGDDQATTHTSATAYFTGVFNQNAMVIDGAGAVTDFRDDLRLTGIYLEDAKSS